MPTDDEYIRPDMSQLPDVIALINTSLASWEGG